MFQMHHMWEGKENLTFPKEAKVEGRSDTSGMHAVSSGVAGRTGVAREDGAVAGASIDGAGAGVKIICCSLRPTTSTWSIE